jgi:co-chaperonin GroES (HSP10)
MSIAGSGDKLASGRQKTATFQGGYGEGELVKPWERPEEEALPTLVDNSQTLFVPKKPQSYYKCKSPLSDRVLVKRVDPAGANSKIIIPDAAKQKSDMGIIVAVTPFTKTGLQPGSIVLFDKYAACGMEVPLGDQFGEVSEHLIVQEADILMELEFVEVASEPVQ